MEENQQQPEDIKQELNELRSQVRQARRDRQVLLLLMGAVAMMMLGLKIEVDQAGKPTISFDGTAINEESLLQISSMILLGGAGVRAIASRGEE